jgi:hypothetical protein
MTPPTAFSPSYYNIYADSFMGPGGSTLPVIPFSNGVLNKQVQDPLGFWEVDPAQLNAYPGAAQSRSGYVQLLPTRIAAFTLGSATFNSNLTDSAGGAEAAYFSFPANADIYAYLSNTMIVGAPSWLVFDLAQGAASPATVIKVTVQQDTGQVMWQRIINVQTSWISYKFPLWFSIAASNILVVFTQVTGSGINIGSVRCYQSREPVAIGMANFELVKTITSTVANLPSASVVGAGTRAFVTDATATTYGSTVAGSGSNPVPVFSNGTNWLIG